MDNRILSLLQICDSNFPTGAFSHSFGLETYIQENQVHNKDSFLKWLKVYIANQLIYSDGLACRLAYEALENNNLEYIWELDQILHAQILAIESREGIRKMGERLLTLGNQLYPSKILVEYKEQINANKCNSHPAIAFAMICHFLNIPKSICVMSYLFSTTTSIIQNAVRGIPLGQTDGQLLIKESLGIINKSWEVIQNLNEDDFGISPPGLEISQMKHERMHVRIFMS